jgi:hypothetical protein
MNLILLEQKIIPIIEQIKDSPATQAEIQLIISAVKESVKKSGIISRIKTTIINKIRGVFNIMADTTTTTNTESIATEVATEAVTAVTETLEQKKADLIAKKKAEITATSSSFVKFRNAMEISLINGADDYIIELLIEKLAKM